MAQEIWVNDGGVIKQANEIWVNDGGTVKQVKEGWVNDGGAIKQFFSLVTSKDAVMVAANDLFSLNKGFAQGSPGNFGSMNPSITSNNGYLLSGTQSANAGGVITVFFGSGDNAPNNNNTFKSIEITGTFNNGTKTVTLIRTNGDYDQSVGNYSLWNFTESSNFIVGNNYDYKVFN